MNFSHIFPTDPGSILLLVLSSAISFAVGRYFVITRAKKRQKLDLQRQELALRNRPPEPASQNKSKRKRQLQQGNKRS
jgi:hypothetical protein